MDRLLLIDPDSARRERLTEALEGEGCVVRALESAPPPSASALKGTQLVLLSLDGEAEATALALHRADPLVPVIAFGSCAPSIALATALGRAHAYDCLELDAPEDVRALMPRLHAAATRQAIRRTAVEVAPEIIGSSEKMDQVRRYIGRAAESDANVLLMGESGTGKELVARAVHEHGRRQGGPFIAVNCSAIPGSLMESELFGHEKGSFTGAASRKSGRFEQADGGTLFFDEIGEMPSELQAKLLRVLQAPPGESETVREFTLVGGEKPCRADVRLVFATNRLLSKEVKAGRFREDLYQRIHVLKIQVPPLRERREDIAELAEAFLERHAEAEGIEALRFDPLVLSVLQEHAFPLNVRELEGIIRALVAMKDAGSTVVLGDLPPDVFAEATDEPEPGRARSRDSRRLRTLAEVQAEHVLHVFEKAGGNKSKTARILGISRPALDRKLSSIHSSE